MSYFSYSQLVLTRWLCQGGCVCVKEELMGSEIRYLSFVGMEREERKRLKIYSFPSNLVNFVMKFNDSSSIETF